MLKIWGRTTSSNVQKVLWTCEELGLKFERYDVGGPFGGNDTPEYLAMNPNGLVPTIEDDGFVLWESNSIVRYLAAKHGAGGLCPSDPQQRADAERWMDWQLTVLGPAYIPIFFQLVRTPVAQRDPAILAAAVEKTTKALGILEARLKGRAFLCGDRLTIGDIPFCAPLHRWFTLDVKRPAHPNVEAWYRRLGERPGFRQHIAEVPLS